MKNHQLFLILAVFVLMGCTTTQKGAAIGAGTGAVLGGIIGHQTGGHGVAGAAIGAGAGGLGGALIGERMDSKFCPICGKRFTASQKFCPEDGTELKDIEK